MSMAERVPSRRSTSSRMNNTETALQNRAVRFDSDDDRPRRSTRIRTRSSHSSNQSRSGEGDYSDNDSFIPFMQTRDKQRVSYAEKDYSSDIEYYYSDNEIENTDYDDNEEEDSTKESKRVRRPVQRFGSDSDSPPTRRRYQNHLSPPPKKKRRPPPKPVPTEYEYSSDYSDEEEPEWIVERIIGQKDQSKVRVDVDTAPTTEDEQDLEDTTGDEQQVYYVKFKDKAFIHAKWLTEAELMEYDNGDNALRRFKGKSSRDGLVISHSVPDLLAPEGQTFDSSYTEIDRIINDADDIKTGHEYLVKWNGLQYDECTWEVEADVDPSKIAEYEERLKHSNPIHIPSRWKRPPASDYEAIEDDITANNGLVLRSYQLEGLNWLRFCWFNQRNSILADEMGLGKTAQLVSMVENLRSTFDICGPFLVIAPLSTLGHWKKEFENWSKLNVIVYHGNQTARDLIRECEFQVTDNHGRVLPDRVQFDVLVTNYESVNLDFKLFQDIEWRYVILDEGHKLKNHKGQLYNKLVNLRYEHCTLLTGTPIQNNMEELWSLLHFIDPDNFDDLDEFMQKYGQMTESTQVTEIQEMIGPYILRRKKGDVEKSIIPKEETIIEVELTRIQKTFYKALLQENAGVLLQQITNGAIVSLQNLMMQLRKVCNHPFLIKGAEDSIIKDFIKNQNPVKPQPDSEIRERALIESSGKMILVDKLLPKLKADNHKVLIFSQMVRVLDIIEDFLRARGYTFERIDGATRAIDRNAAMERFSADPERFVFLLSTKAGGVGINLTAADTVIIYDSDWNPQNDIQAEARCHRIGQKAKVKVYRLITNNTYENQMFERASKKLGLDHVVLDGGEVGGDQPMKAKEVEKLLRDGAFALFDGDDAEAEAFCTQDIDQILESRARVFKEDIVAGDGSTFSKAQFKPTNPNDEIENNEFWSHLFVSPNLDTGIQVRRCRQEKFEQDVQGAPIQRDQCTKIVEMGYTNNATDHLILKIANSIQNGLEQISEQIVKTIIRQGQPEGQPLEIDDPVKEYGELTYIVEDRCEKILGRVAYFARLRRALYFVQPSGTQWPTLTPTWENPITEYSVMVGIHRYGFHLKNIQEDAALKLSDVKLLSRRSIEKRVFKIVEAIEKQFPDQMNETAPLDFEPLNPEDFIKNHPDLLSRSSVVEHEAQLIVNTIMTIGKPTDSTGEIDWNKIRDFSNLPYVTNEAVKKIGDQVYELAEREIGETLDLKDFLELENLKLNAVQVKKMQQTIDDLSKLTTFIRTFDEASKSLLKEASKKQTPSFPEWWNDQCDYALISSLVNFGISFVTRWVVDPKLPFRKHIPADLLEGFEKAAEAEINRNKLVRPPDVGELQFLYRERSRLSRSTQIANFVLRRHNRKSKTVRKRKPSTDSTTSNSNRSTKGGSPTVKIINIGTVKKGKAFIGSGYVYPVGYEVLRFLRPDSKTEGTWYSCKIVEKDKLPLFICDEVTPEGELVPDGIHCEAGSVNDVMKSTVSQKWPSKRFRFTTGVMRAFGLETDEVQDKIGSILSDQQAGTKKKRHRRPEFTPEVEANLIDFIIALPILDPKTHKLINAGETKKE